MTQSLSYKDTLKWYENHAREYAEQSKRYASIDKTQLNEFTGYLSSNGKVLDAGCGSGRDTALFQKLGFAVVGIDITANLIVEAKRSYPGVDFQVGDLLSLDFDDSTFDGVWAHASLVHFETEEQTDRAFSEVVRVLKPNGILHLLVKAWTDRKTEVCVDSIGSQGRLYFNFTIDDVKKKALHRNINLIKLEQYSESELDPDKRPGEGIEWILMLGRKKGQSK